MIVMNNITQPYPFKGVWSNPITEIDFLELIHAWDNSLYGMLTEYIDDQSLSSSSYFPRGTSSHICFVISSYSVCKTCTSDFNVYHCNRLLTERQYMTMYIRLT